MYTILFSVNKTDVDLDNAPTGDIQGQGTSRRSCS